jgi:uncharacterized protein
MHGQFRWYELMTSDPTAAQRFYPAVTGWGVQTWDQSTPDNPYRMWTTSGQALAGFMPITPEQKAVGVKPSWLGYIGVENAQETVRRATALGAKVNMGPHTAKSVGTFAILTDPQGATFAILQPETRSPGFDGNGQQGHFSWHELLTTDMDAAFTFYRQLFSWEKVSETDMGNDVGKYLMYGQRGKSYGGIYNRSGRMAQVPPSWFYYVTVPDVRRATDTALRSGAHLVFDVMEVPGGDKVSMFSDPQGAMIALHQAKPQTAAVAAVKAAVNTAMTAAVTAVKVAKVVAQTAQQAAKQAAKRRAASASKNKRARRAAKKKAAKRSRPAGRKSSARRKGIAKKAARRGAARSRAKSASRGRANRKRGGASRRRGRKR